MAPRRALEQMLAGARSGIELDRACLWIAAEEYPDLDVDRYLAELDRLAGRLRERLPEDAGPEELARTLKHVLADEEGFEGNRDEYDDPRNSYLNEVLDRRTGIPITLSVVYMEVARRASFELSGIGFPGHFLVGHRPEAGGPVLDPFHGGRALGETEQRELLTTLFGGALAFGPELLRSVGPDQILFRLLNNLKSLYLRSSELERALAAVDRMLLAVPEAHPERRDRGVLLARLGRPLEALRELVRFRRLAPEDEGGEAVDALIVQLRGELSRRN